MKMISTFLATAFMLMSCGKPSTAELASAPKKIYNIKFVDQSPSKITIVFMDGKKTVASGSCSYIMTGLPSAGGPLLGQIKCADRASGIKANFQTVGSDGKIWAGLAYFGNPPQGGEYGCSSSRTNKRALDCYYKPPGEEPMPGGGVSN